MELRPRLGSKMALVTVLVLSVSILIGITGARVDAQPGKPRLCKGPNQAKCDPAPSPSPNPPTSPSPEPSPVTSPSPEPSPAAAASDQPPPPAGYFGLAPAGSSLPSGADCTALVHRSTWEPRPQNDAPNHFMPDAQAVHNAFAVRPRAQYGTYDPRWDSWLLQRVDGQFTGTTDEIFQWAACKWGVPDNLLRGIAVRESTWFQKTTKLDGDCVEFYGCGDRFSTASLASKTYCSGVAALGGFDYQPTWGGSGFCPQTFSIVGEMSWQNPAWDFLWPDNQNGTFPFNRDSTAFAADYLAAHLRGCYEGWEFWLTRTTGDMWGCVGSWYSGDWHSSAADGYISRVQNEMANHTWLDPSFADIHP
jgi:hypothetical protein